MSTCAQTSAHYRLVVHTEKTRRYFPEYAGYTPDTTWTHKPEASALLLAQPFALKNQTHHILEFGLPNATQQSGIDLRIFLSPIDQDTATGPRRTDGELGGTAGGADRVSRDIRCHRQE
jgi:hypothetical protein